MNISQEHDQRGGLDPPQLRLSTLMWLVAFLCAVFATMTAVSPLAAWGLVLLVLAVFAHVAGNALGTKLRKSGDRPIAGKSLPSSRTAKKVRGDKFAPTTNLSQRYSLGTTILITTGGGALLGIALVGGLLALTYWGKLTWLNITVAGIGSGVIGGLCGFLVSGFVHVSLVAYLQTTRREQPK